MKSFRIARFAPLFALLAAAALPAQQGDAQRRIAAAPQAADPLHAAPVKPAPVEPGPVMIDPLTAALGVSWLADALRFELIGDGKFLGGVIIALRPELRHSFAGLPPLLGDYAVLGVGYAVERLRFDVAPGKVPAGIKLYAQGVLAGDDGIQSTAVVLFGRSEPDASSR